MIEVVPAIDLIGGAVVRLVEGDFARRTDYATDPVTLARDLAKAGFKRLHIVDLDGARAGRVMQAAVVERMVKASGLSVDFGGGVRSRADVDAVLATGVAQVNIGSAAIRAPEFMQACLEHYGPDAIILAADARDGRVAAAGWKDQTDVTLTGIIEQFRAHGLIWALVTDIARDGTLSGPSLDLYAGLMMQFPSLKLIASGGVGDISDVAALNELGCRRVVVGKALLEGRISKAEAVAYAG